MKTHRSTQLITRANALKATAQDQAKEASMPDLTGKKILMTFWHNWHNTDPSGYKQGYPAEVDLLDIPDEYNVIAVAFMKGAGIPTFSPYKGTDEAFRQKIQQLNSQGRAVLISLGGADGHVFLKTGQEEDLKNEIIRLVELYGFDGLDIDLEQSAVEGEDNPTVIPAALIAVKAHYAAQGQNFIISMAPEFPYLSQSNPKYKKYLDALDGYYDFVAPQFYNQGGDGVWVDELNALGEPGWLTQNDDNRKMLFLYYLTDSIVNGTRGYVKIPADKFIIGLPTSNDAAASGYVVDPDDVYAALEELEAAGNPIRGLMNWSINWDMGTDKNLQPYNLEFTERYKGTLSGEGPTPIVRPAPPGAVLASNLTPSSVDLRWEGSSTAVRYNLYRDAVLVQQSTERVSLQTGLVADTLYRFHATAVDAQGTESLPGPSAEVRTPVDVTLPEPGPTPPGALVASEVTQTGLRLRWAGSAVYPVPAATYSLYRNGVKVQTAATQSSIQTGLTPDTLYTFYATATDSQGNESASNTPLQVRTLADVTDPTDPVLEFPAWVPTGRTYEIGDGVSYQGKHYVCRQRHPAQVDWTPTAAVTLWLPVNSRLAAPVPVSASDTSHCVQINLYVGR